MTTAAEPRRPFWSNGATECWSTGVLEYWSAEPCERAKRNPILGSSFKDDWSKKKSDPGEATSASRPSRASWLPILAIVPIIVLEFLQHSCTPVSCLLSPE
jgi:hypothetical protein